MREIMSNFQKWTFGAIILMLFGAFSSVTMAKEVIKPLDVVTIATQGVIDELKGIKPSDRSEAEVSRLVSTYLVPAVDQVKIAKGALGKYWRKTTPEQKEAFIQRFRERQIRTYMGAFKAFSGESLTFTETRYNEKRNKAVVKGLFKQVNGNEISMDFRLYFNNSEQRWYVYDAVVAGLSMIKTYRSQLSERLQNIDMDTLLAELQAEDAGKNIAAE